MAFAVRTATMGDAEAITALLVASRTSIYRGVLPDRYLDDDLPDEVDAYWRMHLPAFVAGDGTVLVAESEGRVVAFIALFAPDEHGSVYVGNLHAAPERRGGGAGTALLAAGRAWAAARGARAMHLLVVEANLAAARFYEARGWRCTGRDTDTMGGVDVAVLRYALVVAAGVTDASCPTARP